MTYPKENIPNEDSVYRLVHNTQYQKENKEIPRPAMFAPRQGQQEISVDWSRYTTPTECKSRVGKTYKPKKKDEKENTDEMENKEFKNPDEFHVYEMNVGAIRQIQPKIEVLHDPLFTGDPEPEGNPNNRSHAHIVFPSKAVQEQLLVAEALLAIAQRVL